MKQFVSVLSTVWNDSTRRLPSQSNAGAQARFWPPEGRKVFAIARDILTDATTLKQTSERMKTGLVGMLCLGSSRTFDPYLLLNVIQSMHDAYPELSLIIRDGAPYDLLEELLKGEHDVVLT